jgi:hypothetical protein
MLRRKALIFIVAAIAAIYMSGMAFAANTVGIQTTSEPIRALSVSDKSGGFTLTFDSNTVLTAGDRLTADLPLNVSVAREINHEISPTGSGSRWNADNTGAAPVSGTVTTPGAGNTGVYFRVFGAVGSQRITITVEGQVGVDSLVVGAAPTDVLILTVLDTSTSAIFRSDTEGAYLVPGTIADNTLCINVSQYAGETVRLSFDSKDDKFTYNPSNPQVAHVIGALDINLATCSKSAIGRIVVGERGGQGGQDDCTEFDNDSAEGYCPTTHYRNQIVIRSNAPFDASTYRVGLEILVNGNAGANGVYWSGSEIHYAALNDFANICNLTDPLDNAIAATAFGANNGVVTGFGNDGCDVPAANRSVRILSNTTSLGIAPNTTVIRLGIPSMVYDLDEINEGDVVSVRVTLLKEPCGTVFTGIKEVGTFGCEVVGESRTMLFPYFTEMATNATPFWAGIVVTNVSGNAGQFTITVYEKDGDVGTYGPVTVAARSHFVSLISDLLPQMTKTGGTGTLGDASAYYHVSGDFSMDGFAMIANQSSGESMGYLPRLSLEVR